MPNAIQSEYLRVASVLDRNGLHEQAEDLMARYAMKMATITHGDYPGDPETLQRVAALEEFIVVTADSDNEAPEFRSLASRLGKIRRVYEDSLRTAAAGGGADNEVMMILESSAGSIFRSLMTQAYESAWNHLYTELSKVRSDDPWFIQHQNLLAVDNDHVIFNQEAAQTGASYSTPLPDGSTGFGVMQQFLTTHGSDDSVRAALIAAVKAQYLSSEDAGRLLDQVRELPGLFNSVATWAPKLNKGVFKRLFSKSRFPAGKVAAQSANVRSDARILMDLALNSAHTDTLAPDRAEEMVAPHRSATEQPSDADAEIVEPADDQDDDELERMQQGWDNHDPWASLSHLGVSPEDIEAIRNATGAEAAEYFQHLNSIQHEVDEIADPAVDKEAVRKDIQAVLEELQQKAGTATNQQAPVVDSDDGDKPVPPSGPPNVMGLLNGEGDDGGDNNDEVVDDVAPQHTDWRTIDPTDVSGNKFGHLKWNNRFNVARDGRSGLNTIIMTVPEIIPLLNAAQGDPERIKEIVHGAARIAHARLTAHYAAAEERHVQTHGPVKPQSRKLKEVTPDVEAFVDQAISDYAQDNNAKVDELSARAKSEPLLMLAILKHAATKHAAQLHEAHQNGSGEDYFENGDKFWRRLRIARHLYGGSQEYANPQDPKQTKIPGRRAGESLNHMYPDTWGWSHVADAAADAAASDDTQYDPRDYTSGRQQRDWDTWRASNQGRYQVLKDNTNFHPSMLEGVDEHDHSGFGEARGPVPQRQKRQQQNGPPAPPVQTTGVDLGEQDDGDLGGGGGNGVGGPDEVVDDQQATIPPIKQSLLTEVGPDGGMVTLTRTQLQEMLDEAVRKGIQNAKPEDKPQAAQSAVSRILSRFKPKLWRVILPLALVALTGIFGLQRARQITTNAGRAEMQQSLSRDQSPAGQYGTALEPGGGQTQTRQPAPQPEMKRYLPTPTAPQVAPTRPKRQQSDEVELDPVTHQPTLMGPLGK